jgi:hypothetical protein
VTHRAVGAAAISVNVRERFDQTRHLSLRTVSSTRRAAWVKRASFAVAHAILTIAYRIIRDGSTFRDRGP